MIVFDNVSKAFSPKSSALLNVSFTIEAGEFVFLVGPSGAGKSTILSLLIRQLLPSSGDIKVNDWDIDNLPRKKIPLLRRKIGSIFQDYKLLMDRTVEENVALSLEVQGKPAKEIKQFVTEALDVVGLNGKANFFPQELAGGEVQRVAIARAIVANPEILLADEPTADLDPKNAWAIVQLLDKINKENHTTIIMATHNTDIVNQMKRRVIVLENGQVISDEKDATYTYPEEKKEKVSEEIKEKTPEKDTN